MDMSSIAPAIVLVNPQMGENIGMCARAMLNCGVTDLRLVSPRDGWPNESARNASSNAMRVIDNACVYSSLADAIADCTYTVATTARSRDMLKPVLTPETAAEKVFSTNRRAGMGVSAIIFGPERTGLVNDDVAQCDAILTIPLNPEYSSLNLSQAVLLLCYEWHKLYLKNNPALDSFNHSDIDAAPKGEMQNLMAHMTDALDESGFFTSAGLRPVVLRNLQNTFQRLELTRQEIHSLHGMIKAIRGKEWKK